MSSWQPAQTSGPVNSSPEMGPPEMVLISDGKKGGWAVSAAEAGRDLNARQSSRARMAALFTVTSWFGFDARFTIPSPEPQWVGVPLAAGRDRLCHIEIMDKRPLILLSAVVWMVTAWMPCARGAEPAVKAYRVGFLGKPLTLAELSAKVESIMAPPPGAVRMTELIA